VGGEGTEKANHREHGEHKEKQTTEDTEVGKDGTETLGRTLGKVRLQRERWVGRARRRQTTEDTEDTEKNKPRRTQRGRAATKQAWRLRSHRQLAPVAA